MAESLFADSDNIKDHLDCEKEPCAINFNQFSPIYEQTTPQRRFKNTYHKLPDNNSLKQFDPTNLHVSVYQSYFIFQHSHLGCRFDI